MFRIDIKLFLLAGYLLHFPASAQDAPCVERAVSLKEKIACTQRAQTQYGIKKNSLNFGVVVYNNSYQIYRSKWLGKKGLEKLSQLLHEKNLPFPKTIIYMNKTGYKSLLDFDVYAFYGGDFALEEHALQKKYGFRFLHSFDYPYRTYLDGHNPFEPRSDIDKKNRLNRKALNIFGADPGDGPDGDTVAFRRILEAVLDTANQPVLFHCWGGRHRTGMVGMVLRYMQGGHFTRPLADSSTAFDRRGKPMKAGNMAQLEYFHYTRGPGNAISENISFIEQYVETEAFREFRERYGNRLNGKGRVDNSPAGENR
jgi:hypothetical protein